MKTRPSILVVDDNKDFLTGIIRNLKKGFSDHDITGVTSGEAALDLLRKKEMGVMLSDMKMPGLSGRDLLSAGLAVQPHLCVVMITGHGTVETAVEALKKGAWDFLTKPVDRDTLFHTVDRALEYHLLASENQRLQAMIQDLTPDLSLICESRAMKSLEKKITAIARTDYTVLVTGESGAGKEYIARAIHELSKRQKKACHSLNCPAIPEPLLESELFGHVKGAFTGAERDRKGFFMSADKGTLILDEIGDISLPIQAKLLKFLQDKEVKPVGASGVKTADVRIIALTNQNLEQKILDKSFREDLYYRLNVLSLTVPPLRKRKNDIPMLVRKFIIRTCKELDMDPIPVDPSALAYLSAQPWPGNVRELLNTVRRLAVFSNGKTIDLPLINQVAGDHPPGKPEDGGITRYKDAKKIILDQFSRQYLHDAFEQTRGNISETSRLSGLERASIQKIVKRLDIDMDQYRG